MKCPKCRSDNPEGSKFCNQCATPLTAPQDKRLEMVKSTLPETMKNKILSAKIEGERKNVTVLFADVSGFTELSEKLDPEEVTDIINNLFKVLIAIVYEYEGTIDKLIGDCIMALFGAPITHEDDQERAVHTALEIMGALDKFNEEQKTNLSIHIGINCGLVIVGAVGSDLRMDYTVMGDTVNLAERLTETAKDEILVSESIYKKTSYLFEMNVLEPVTLKGKSEKIIPCRVIGKKGTPMRKRGIPGLYSSLVGRDKELKALKSALNHHLTGKAVAVSVIGETGLGKSRLIQEIGDYAGKKVEWLSGSALSYGKHFPCRIFQEQIRSFLEIAEFEIEGHEKLKRKAKILFKDKINEYYPYLCLFLSLNVPEHLQEKIKYLEPEPLKLQTFASVKALFRKIAKTTPLLLYFEDMHLIDSESIELLKFLLDGLKDDPIFFLFEMRPEKESGVNKIRKSIQKILKKGYSEIKLQALGINNAKTLVQNLLKIPGLSENVSSLIIKKSEGNPFYIEEIIGTLIDAKLLQMKNEEWDVVADISSFEIPDTVEAVIRARIDKLPTEVKEVLGIASVIGRSFLYKILSRVSEINNLEYSLNTLEERQFIMMKKSQTAVISPDTEYIFKHILTRDICYQGLLKKKRRQIHKKVAECMEDIFQEKIEDHYNILALHYYNANDFEKAYYYYKKAGDTEKELYRNNSAIECYTKSIEIHEMLFAEEENEKIAELLEKRGDVKELKAEYDSALKDFEKALKYYGGVEKKARVKSKIGNIFSNKSEYDTAILHYENSIELLKTIPEQPLLSEILIDYAKLLSRGRSDFKKSEKTIEQALSKIDKNKEPRIYAHGLNTLGGIYYRRGDYDRALEHRQKAMAIREELKDKRGIADGYINVGAVYYRKGQLNKALEFYKRSLEITEEIGYKWGIGQACRNIGLVYRVKGESNRALKYYKRCLAISEEIGNKSGIAAVFFNMGHIYLAGELDKALKYYKQCLAISEEIGNKGGIGQVSNNIGIVYRYKGGLDTALKYYKRYLTIAEEIGDKWGIGVATGNIGFVYFDKGELDKALEYGKKSLGLFEEIGYKGGIGLASQVIGCVHRERGEIKQALNCFERHLAIYETMGIQREISRAYLGIGSLYTEIQRFDDAREYLEKAEEIVKQTGGKIDLSEAYVNLAELNTIIKNYKPAADFAKRALSLAEETGAKTNKVLALRALGLALSQQKPEQALTYLKKSISIARKQNIKLELAKSLFELAKIMLETGNNIVVALQKLKEAEKIFKKAGAKGWMEKVDKLTKKRGESKTKFQNT